MIYRTALTISLICFSLSLMGQYVLDNFIKKEIYISNGQLEIKTGSSVFEFSNFDINGIDQFELQQNLYGYMEEVSDLDVFGLNFNHANTYLKINNEEYELVREFVKSYNMLGQVDTFLDQVSKAPDISTRYIYSYDLNENLVQLKVESITSGEWKTIREWNYTYDSNGNKIESADIFFMQNGTKIETDKYEFNDDNQIVLNELFVSNMAPKLRHFRTVKYENNQVDSVLFFAYNEENGEYDFSEYVKHYYSNGQLDSSLTYYFNSSTGEFNSSFRSVFAYDNQGNLVLHSRAFNATSDFFSERRYTYNDDGFLTYAYECKRLLDCEESIERWYNFRKIITSSENLKERNKLKISISPNPTNDYLNIVSNELITKVEILNVNGEIVYLEYAGNRSLDLSSINKGIYFIRLYTAESNATMKFIKIE